MLVVVWAPDVALMTKAVAVAPDGDDVTVMKQTVDKSGGHDLVTEDRAPLLETFVAARSRPSRSGGS